MPYMSGYSSFPAACLLTSSRLHQYVSIACPGEHRLPLSGSCTLNGTGNRHGGGEKEGCCGCACGSMIASGKDQKTDTRHPSLNPCKLRFGSYAHGS